MLSKADRYVEDIADLEGMFAVRERIVAICLTN